MLRVVVILAIVLVGLLPGSVGAATVSGTDAVSIRSCPSLECGLLAVAPLGAALKVTGDPENGFLPVLWEGTPGFAYRLFVTEETVPPWLVQGDPECKQVALIFNIGIGGVPSQTVLDILKWHGVPATMFPMGWWALEHPDYLRQLRDAGFTIGTHGDQPFLPTTRTDAEIMHDVEASIEAIESVIGRPVDPWITPYAADSDERVRAVVAGMGLMPVGWTVAANDYDATATSDAIYRRVMDSVHPGAIVEMHLDGPATEWSTAAALPGIIGELRALGYTLASVPDLAAPCETGIAPDPAGLTSHGRNA